MTDYLARVAEGLSRLSSASDDLNEITVDIQHQCTGPPRVLVVGRVSTGKSTLINALAGDLAAESRWSEATSAVTTYSDVVVGADLAEHHLTVDLVDTPGVSGEQDWGGLTKNLLKGKHPKSNGYSVVLLICKGENFGERELEMARAIASSPRSALSEHPALLLVVGKLDLVSTSTPEEVEARAVEGLSRYCFGAVAVSQGSGYSAHVLRSDEGLRSSWMLGTRFAGMFQGRQDATFQGRSPDFDVEGDEYIRRLTNHLPIDRDAAKRLLSRTSSIREVDLAATVWDLSRMNRLLDEVAQLVAYDRFLRASAVSSRLTSLFGLVEDGSQRDLVRSLLLQYQPRMVLRSLLTDGVLYRLHKSSRTGGWPEVSVFEPTMGAVRGDHRLPADLVDAWRRSALDPTLSSRSRALAADVLAYVD